MSKVQKKIKKYFEYAYTKVKLLFTEKRFQKDGVTLKYLFEKNKDSSSLAIVFGSCVRKGLTARYNYVRTLKAANINKLFILDDFAPDKRGCYYLGEYPDYIIKNVTSSLIEEKIKETGAKKVYFCGSSKGGYASLLFGIDIKTDVEKIIISGAPQYNLGNYLKSFDITFPYIRGNYNDDEVILSLNLVLKDKIEKLANDNSSTKIFLHYSSEEHTYNEHVKDLISDLKKNNYLLYENIEKYTDHSDVALYFPSFLIETIKENENEKS